MPRFNPSKHLTAKINWTGWSGDYCHYNVRIFVDKSFDYWDVPPSKRWFENLEIHSQMDRRGMEGARPLYGVELVAANCHSGFSVHVMEMLTVAMRAVHRRLRKVRDEEGYAKTGWSEIFQYIRALQVTKVQKNWGDISQTHNLEEGLRYLHEHVLSVALEYHKSNGTEAPEGLFHVDGPEHAAHIPDPTAGRL